MLNLLPLRLQYFPYNIEPGDWTEMKRYNVRRLRNFTRNIEAIVNKERCANQNVYKNKRERFYGVKSTWKYQRGSCCDDE